ncbi:MAG: FtsX-like permease family protein, partial [Gemmatimonadota bacterium]|nr:FtsX-like permease family protein [Gemmatimonadota bacterium]
PALLTALAADLGDTLALGEARFVIAGTVENFPGDVGLGSAFSPRVVISARDLEATELLRFGSRAQYAAYFRLPAPSEASALAERIRPGLRPELANVRSADEDQQQLGRALERLTSYLGLVALVALLLGGLGVASAVHVFLRQKLETIAVLRCLGATARQVFAVYLLQAIAMGLAGSILGVALGLAIQLLLPQVLGDFLPVDVTVRPSAQAIASGVGMGLWVSIAFSLLPLLAVRRVSPLAAIRRMYDERPPRPGPARWVVLALLAASVVVLARLQVSEWLTALSFAGGVGVALLLLALCAWALVRMVRRWFPQRWPYVWRQGLANLYRPANQTVTVVLALGFGAFLLSTIYLVQHNLLRTLSLGGDAVRPNLVLIDVQPDQRAGVDSTLATAGYPALETVPIVPMRIRTLDGRPADEILADTTAGEGEEVPERWAVRREYRSTYRDSLTGSEQVVLGEWGWRDDARDGGDEVYDISIEAGVAAELGVALGDEIVWDVQGVPVATRITSLREVDWARFEPNFFVVFEPAALMSAPQTFVTLTRVPDPAARGRVQRSLVERFPNVTSLDLSLVQQTVERVVSRVVLAVRFMALFSLATGALVLVGAVATTRFQRLREGVLLRTLGATRGQVVRIVAAEYLALGALAALVAVGLASLAGWGLAKWLFEIPFGVPVPQLAAVAATVVLLTTIVGAFNSRDALSRPPLEVLRNE